MSFRSIREWAGRNPRTVAAIATASTAVTWFTSQHAEQISNNVAEETYNVAEEVKGIWDAGFTQAREKVSDLCEKLPALTGMIRPQRRIQPTRRPTEERKRPADGPPAEEGAASTSYEELCREHVESCLECCPVCFEAAPKSMLSCGHVLCVACGARCGNAHL